MYLCYDTEVVLVFVPASFEFPMSKHVLEATYWRPLRKVQIWTSWRMCEEIITFFF